MVVTTAEVDKYSAKKLKAKGTMNGRILTPIRRFPPNESLSGVDAGFSALSEVPTAVYSTSTRS